MRNLLLGIGLIFVGCNSNNNNNNIEKDLAVPVVNHDLAVNGDLNGVSTCDPVKQDCGAGQKCTYQAPDPMGSIIAVCTAVTGSKGFEEGCMRDMNNDPGTDDCKAGFFCSAIGWGGVAGMNQHCNQMCRTTMDCPANHHCIPRTDFSGDCVRDCGKLNSTSCGTGEICSSILNDIDSTQQTPDLFLTCRVAGTGAIGDACMDDTDCGANLLCDPTDMVCVDGLCDDTRSCPAGDMGLICQTVNNSGSLGICQ